MLLQSGHLLEVTRHKVVGCPHYAIVSSPFAREYTDEDAKAVMDAVRVIHFCRGDPLSTFDDGSKGAPLSTPCVRETTLARFVSMGVNPCIEGGGPPSSFLPDEVVGRARAELGSTTSHRDGQSFATYCYYGIGRRDAVRFKIAAVVFATVCVLAAGIAWVGHELAELTPRP
jgi:hypothetical protein